MSCVAELFIFSKMLRANLGKSLEIEARGKRWARYPIATPLIVPGVLYQEWYARALEQSGLRLAPEDIVFAGEKAIAIAEGRAWATSSIHPTRVARFLARFVMRNPAGIGISIPETMQLALDEVGNTRIIFAAIASAGTKLLGIKGIFYRIAGRRVAMIDGPVDYAIPPYNEYCSLGPKDPDAAARGLAAALGVRVAVVDANDLGVAIVGRSDTTLDAALLEEILRDNPLGQGDEQTPLGVIRAISAD